MSVLFDYFTAGSDEQAATVIDRTGGPGAHSVPGSRPSPERRGWFRRRQTTQTAVDLDLVAFDTVRDTGIDPVVQLGTLEELLTGRPYDEVVDDPRSGRAIASRDGGERIVCSVTLPLTEALAHLPRARTHELAAAWSQTEEFWGEASPDDVERVLLQLADLAHRARASGQNLYCWVCM